MTRGDERRQWMGEALTAAGLDALICTLPENVLVLSGYWPVVGTAVAVATADGRTAVLAPTDEHDLACGGWAQDVRTFQPGSLKSLAGPEETVREPLAALLRDLGVAGGRIAHDNGGVYEGSSYAAMHLYGARIRDILDEAAPQATLTTGDEPIARLRSRLTADEVAQVRLACRIAGSAFIGAARGIQPGLREPDVAAAFQAPLSIEGLAQESVERASGFTWCMSGPNSAQAGAAYARTRDRALQGGDFVLVHCNSYINGYWTDITRTYCLGDPDERQRAIYDAIFAARAAALEALHPDVQAADVDRAARDVLTERGFGDRFTHGLGHNVGFSVISAEFPPRLHPASPDRLQVGSTFNVEPAIYIEGYGGVRHCDVVTLHEDGPEVLTPFQASMDELILGKDDGS